MKQRPQRPFVHYLAVWGCISTGIIYGAVGMIAILSFFRLKKGGADEGSLFAYLDQYAAGKIISILILGGAVAYIAWRIYETVRDPYQYGRTAKGILRRSATALSSFADALIVVAAIQVYAGDPGIVKTGEPAGLRTGTETMLEQPWGATVLYIIGGITLVAALAQFGYVITKGYRERMDLHTQPTRKRQLIDVLAWTGHFARGIIIGIIGFFFIKAAAWNDAQMVVNTDKAFDFLGDHVSHAAFLIVAAGTIAYGIFMVFFGVYYDSDSD